MFLGAAQLHRVAAQRNCIADGVESAADGRTIRQIEPTDGPDQRGGECDPIEIRKSGTGSAMDDLF